MADAEKQALPEDKADADQDTFDALSELGQHYAGIKTLHPAAIQKAEGASIASLLQRDDLYGGDDPIIQKQLVIKVRINKNHKRDIAHVVMLSCAFQYFLY